MPLTSPTIPVRWSFNKIRACFSRLRSSFNKNRCLAFAAATLSAGLVLGARAQSSSAQAPPALKLAEQQYKNIKALTGIPAEQVIPAMQFITASLGVECEYCHVRQDKNMAFDKDDKKPKVVARKMIQMMFAINKDNFEGKREVTCYSCHRGAADPVGTPLVSTEELPPDAAAGPGGSGEKKSDATAPVLPSAVQLFDKYLAASGGADAVQKVTSRIEKGTLTAFGGQHFPVDIYAKAPDKRVSVMHLPNGDSVTAFDGHAGWLSVPGRPPHFMTADEIAGARLDADLHFPAGVKTLASKWMVTPGEKIDGRETIQVAGSTEGRPPLKLYFDPQTGLLLRLVRYNETPLGRLPTQIDYSDYREADGVKLPYRWTLARPGNRFTIQVAELHQNVPVDEAKFTPPPPPPPPDQKPAGH
jgi:photosynthetic reaction center cytochrome c subunit